MAYSCFWPHCFGLVGYTGVHLYAGDLGNILIALVIGAPAVFYPLLFCPSPKRVVNTYWFKFLVWMAIFVFIATYFFTEVFFDVLGMKYNFPHLQWTFDSVLLGSGKQTVPLMMYVYGWFFFITYHTLAVIFMRVLRPWLGDVLTTIFSAWFFSWAEIRFSTMDSIKDQFEYKDMDFALSYGAWIYACYFIASFPMVARLDEDTQRWTFWYTVQNAFAAGSISFVLLDLVCSYVITERRSF